MRLRTRIRWGLLLAPLALCMGAALEAGTQEEVPPHYRALRPGEPQLFVDDYLVENRYTEAQISADVPHVWHAPKKHGGPLITLDPDKPWEKHGMGYAGVVYDPRVKLHRIYYQVWNPEVAGQPGYPRGHYSTCVAESPDGLRAGARDRPAAQPPSRIHL